MKQLVFKMKLKQDCEAEYRRQHDEIWPELVTLLKQGGIKNYNIFFDKETNTLVAVQYVDDSSITINLHENPLMFKWWHYMADLMEVNSDKSPVVIYLDRVFEMP